VNLLLLPGLDGTTRLFGPFLAALPPSVQPLPWAYPLDRVLGYDELLTEIPVPQEPFVVLGESFGGPLALKLAARKPSGLRGVVLVATFIGCPVRMPRAAASWLRPWMFRRPPPGWLVRRNLSGRDTTKALTSEVQSGTGLVRPDVLVHRIQEVLRVDVARELRECHVPVLSLSGARDRLVRRRNVEAMKAVRPSLECIQLDTPHLVLQTQPVLSAEHILRWLRTLGLVEWEKKAP
jgi:pimeloyl-[acyl-carrier protein] methyl ester esterase